VEGLAKAGAELAQQLCQRAAVIVLSDRVSGTVRVVAGSTAADKRLTGLTLAGTAAAARAVQTGLPVATRGGEDVFGPGVPERRRQDREGTAYPLVDGHFPVGALVLLGAPLAPDDPKTEQVGRLVVELGPRLVAALAVHEAEQRAVRDPLTGLVNRREFERQLDTFRQSGGEGGAAATLIYVDLDHFKKLNDTFGHPAGDAALRHVATILTAQIRDGDIVARIGGEEFAVWLPRTDLPEGAEIAERVRRAVEGTAWHWNGTPYPLSASCGVATFPDPVRDVNNLRTTADAALYRAKQEGRNRVAIAGAEG
jgi:diguanylate cyclase (GGDEF)-like protein